MGLDTFRPMEAGPIADHRMHRERFSVPAATVEAIERTRHLEGRVVAVGTTVVRSLETAAGVSGLSAGEAESGLFITPGYRLRVVDAVIIDKQITDGILVIWKGVTLPEIKAFDKVAPRLGEDPKTWKKRLRDS